MKPRIGVFGFTSCSGCQLQIVNLEDEIVDLLGAIDIAYFKMAMSEHSDNYSIAFIEGAITRESEIDDLRWIRENADKVVALGACACIGGIPYIKNFIGVEKAKNIVYGDSSKYFDSIPTKPIDQIINVDGYIRGCPINKNEFLKIAKSLLLDIKPLAQNYPVCVECKLNENICVFDRGMTCLGPVTYAGCNSSCPNVGNQCYGCRGLLEDANINSQKDILEKHGLTVHDVLLKFRLYDGYAEESK
jgi:coenzyme F420-reducing hydrogenase gamma subunit